MCRLTTKALVAVGKKTGRSKAKAVRADEVGRQGRRQRIAIIIPVYNEAQNAPLLYREILKYLKKLPYEFEFIYVDDGSHDGSPEVIGELAKDQSNVRLIQFSRNFGKEAAVSAGLHAAYRDNSDAALILDADFQHPPELIGKFIDKWQRGAEVVVGIRRYGDSERWFKRFSSDMFYRLIKPISHTEIIPHASDFRLLDRKVISAFNQLSERNRMTRGLIDWLGFKRDFVHFQAAERKYGERSYSYRKLLRLAMTSFTAYTLLPLRLAGYIGVIIMLFALPAGLFAFAEMFIMGDPMQLEISNVVLLALLLTFLVGIILACLGLVAMYIAHIHAEVANRPLYVVRDEVASASPEPVDPELSAAGKRERLDLSRMWEVAE